MTATLAVIGGLTVFGCLALAAVLMITPGPESTQRLGLFFGVVGTVVAALVAMLRTDQAPTQTNGSLDARIHDSVKEAVEAAMADRRSTDRSSRNDSEA